MFTTCLSVYHIHSCMHVEKNVISALTLQFANFVNLEEKTKSRLHVSVLKLPKGQPFFTLNKYQCSTIKEVLDFPMYIL